MRFKSTFTSPRVELQTSSTEAIVKGHPKMEFGRGDQHLTTKEKCLIQLESPLPQLDRCRIEKEGDREGWLSAREGKKPSGRASRAWTLLGSS